MMSSRPSQICARCMLRLIARLSPEDSPPLVDLFHSVAIFSRMLLMQKCSLGI